MSNEDEEKKAEIQALQEATRALEEKNFEATDVKLRSWERDRHLHRKIANLESRVKLLVWLALALLLGSAAMFAFLVKGQVSPLHDQLAVLQEKIAPLQARVDEFARPTKIDASKTASAPDEATVKRLEQEVLESVKKLAPEILAAAVKENEQGSADNNGSKINLRAAVGAAQGSTGDALRLVVGQTDPQKTNWVQYNHGGIYVDIDTSSAEFSSTPYYFTSLSGHTNNWMAQGVTSIYLPTAKGFRVHVGYRELTAEQAKKWGWSISWIAIGK